MAPWKYRVIAAFELADRNFKRHSAGRREFPHCCLALQERALRSTAAPPAGGYASPGLCTRAPHGAAWTGCAGWGRAVGGPTEGRPRERRFWESWGNGTPCG